MNVDMWWKAQISGMLWNHQPFPGAPGGGGRPFFWGPHLKALWCWPQFQKCTWSQFEFELANEMFRQEQMKSLFLSALHGWKGARLQCTGVVCRRMVIPYEGQSFSSLRRGCQQAGRLFEDPLFPAADQSLFYQSNRIGRVTWKRPKVSGEGGK